MEESGPCAVQNILSLACTSDQDTFCSSLTEISEELPVKDVRYNNATTFL